MRRASSMVAAATAIALLAGCGTEVNSATRRQLAEAQLRGPGATSDVGAGAPGNGTSASAGSGTLPQTSGSSGGGLLASGAPTGGKSGTTTSGTTGKSTTTSSTGGSTSSGASGALPSGIGAPAPAGGNGGSTDVGVTGNQILLGNVSDLSGPQPGLFQTAVAGTNAYIAYINSLGGIYGRKLKVDVADSQTSCEGDRNGTQSLIGKVFAFAGSFALSDVCAASVLGAHRDVPDAHLAVTPQANALPNNYSVNPVGSKVNNGPYAWATKKFGRSIVQHVGMLWANLPAVNNVAQLSMHSASTAGWRFIQRQSVSPIDTDFTAEIVRMRQSGVKLFYSLFDAQELAEFVRNADQQNFHPVIIAPLAYDQTLFTDMGGSGPANGIYGFAGSALFFSAADAARIPSVALFQKWYGLVTGNAPADTFAADAWAETELLVKAIAAAGPDLTRRGVLGQLAKIHSFDADGLFAPADPADKRPGNCYVLWQIRGGQYLRLDEPATGFRCDGKQE